MAKEVNPCNGCICTTCAKSEFNGVLYKCSVKACDNCEQGEYIVKRTYCDEYISIDDYSADDIRL